MVLRYRRNIKLQFKFKAMNLFNFDYEEAIIPNLNGEPSRFRGIYGLDGNLINTAKGGKYNVVRTEDLSRVGEFFLDQGKSVIPYTHKDGEVIGLTIPHGVKPHKVGDRMVTMVLDVLNNGYGAGKLSLMVKRLVCTNGAMKNEYSNKGIIKIPHTNNYKYYLELAQEAMVKFETMINQLDEFETNLNGQKIDLYDVKKLLNEWFYKNEIPASGKEDMSEQEFRMLLVDDFDSLPNATKTRYKELQKSIEKELSYNKELGLEVSKYTTYAVVTNYLSRRREQSAADAPEVILMQRQQSKIEHIEELLTF